MPDAVEKRAFANAQVQLRAVDDAEGDGRTVFGIAVPYNVDQYIHWGLTERFVPGAFDEQIKSEHRVPYAWEHQSWGGKPVGRVTKLEDRPEGLYFEARLSRTPTADELLELTKDGAIAEVSIGFISEVSEIREDVSGETVTVRTKARLTEISAVYMGAYGENAVVTGVRSKPPGDGPQEPPQPASQRAKLTAFLALAPKY